VTILLVRPRLIGDVILTTPAVRALRRRFPDATLLYLVETTAAPVVASNPHLTEVVAVPYRRGWRRVRDDMRLAAQLVRRRIDVAIDLHGGPRSAWLTWATRAPMRVGYDMPGREWMYTRVVPRWRGEPRHSVLNQWDLIAAVDPALAGPPTPADDPVEMCGDPSAEMSVQARLDRWGVAPDDRVIVVHVSARNPFRRWPESSFAELVCRLASTLQRWVVVVGGPSDRDAAERVRIAAQARTPAQAPRIVSGEGLSLAEFRSLVDRAAVFIGGDSGPMHITATTATPIVALYGPTLASQWAPWRPPSLTTIAVEPGTLPCRPCDQRACAPGDFRCLTRIGVSAVHEAAERVLESAR
jgi:lipopolysaccharide heptosyltransferase II